MVVGAREANRKEGLMGLFETPYRRRRHSGIWVRLRQPRFLRAIIKMAWVIYRVVRMILNVFTFFG